MCLQIPLTFYPLILRNISPQSFAYSRASSISRASCPWSSRSHASYRTQRNCFRRSHRPWSRAIQSFHLEHPGNCLETLCLAVQHHLARQKRADSTRVETHLTRCPIGCNRSSSEFASIASVAIAAAAIIERTSHDSIRNTMFLNAYAVRNCPLRKIKI